MPSPKLTNARQVVLNGRYEILREISSEEMGLVPEVYDRLTDENVVMTPSFSTGAKREIINGRYEILQEIGSGGMGVVLKVRDRLTGQVIALKRVYLNPEKHYTDSNLSDKVQEKLRVLLAKEFQTLAGLRHPNIISVLDYGFDADQQPFYTMTYIGESQTILEAGNKLGLEEKIDLIEQLLHGLAYLHRNGILHKDIKPENILVADGLVRLLDFGLSHKASEKSSTGGSPKYIAPELVGTGEATKATDLYAVGVHLYQFLAGGHPFGELDFRFYDRLLDEEPEWKNVPAVWQPLLQSLLAKSPEERPQSADDVLLMIAGVMGKPAPTETVAIRESYLQAATFIGRTEEIKLLTNSLQLAKDGKNSAWLIGGESGVGKTRLLDEVQTAALVDGWQVWRGQAAESGGLPYQLWRAIVAQLVLSTKLSALELSILKEIAPVIDRLSEQKIPSLVSSDSNIDQERLSLTLIEGLKRQTQPTLLLLEDIHWAQESLALIKQHLNRIESLPNVVMIGTYRSDERPSLPAELSEAKHIYLDRLSRREVQQLSESILGDRANSPEIVSLLTQETEGNTFFIIEVMRALAEEAGKLGDINQTNLPTGVLTSGMEDLLNRRIQKIPAADLILLQKAAVAGRHLDLSLLAQFTSTKKLRDWLQKGLDAAVLSIRDNQWFFSHDKLRETLINGLSEEQTKQYNRQVAESIEILYPDDSSYDQLLLEHWHKADNLNKEIHYLEPVARYLIQSVAQLTKAEELLQRGLFKLSDSDSRRVSLLNWLTYAYMEEREATKFEMALTIGQQARSLAKVNNNQSGLATSLYYMGNITFEIDGTNERADGYIHQSLAYAESINDQKRVSDNLILLGEIAHNMGHIDESIAYHKEALSIVEAIGSNYGLGYSLDQLGQIFIIQGDYEKASEYLLRSIKAFQAGGYEQRYGWTLLSLANIPMLLGKYDEALDYLSRCLVAFQKHDVKTGIGYCLNNFGRAATLMGNYDEALDYVYQSIEIFEKDGIVRAVGYNLLQLGLLMSLMGRFEEAEHHLRQGLTDFQELEDQRMVAYCYSRLGFVNCITNPSKAEEMLYNALSLAKDLDIEPCILEILYGYACLFLMQGNTNQARKLIDFVTHHPKANGEIQLWLLILKPKAIEASTATPLSDLSAETEHLNMVSVVQALMSQGEGRGLKNTV
ncbi:MAG: tetratricopeptide repeat protein [Chloroflexota bacterium]